MQQKSTCHQHRMEIHRGLELLSDYYAKLTKSQEKQSTIEIERLIRILKSRFFQALIDIQEFYELTSFERIQNNNFLTTSHDSLNIWSKSRETIRDSSSPTISYYENELRNAWESKEIVIPRGKSGFGFSIAGGTDNPHFPNDVSIYVTKIIPNGAAAIEGQLRVRDIIEKANDICLTYVTHTMAVNTLKQADNSVKLNIRRKNFNKDINKIELWKKADGFGFSIAGGIGNQHLPGENGIYVTKIMDGGIAQQDGRLKVGHKLLAIKNSAGFRDLENVTHEEAVETLKSTQDEIVLYTVHPVEYYSQNDLSNEQILTKGPLANNLSFKINEESNIIPNKEKNKDLQQIKLNRGSYGFGFNIVGGNNDGIYVSLILNEGPAFYDGNLREGDRIIQVNSTDFMNISHEDAVKILRREKNKINIVIERNTQNYEKFREQLQNIRRFQTEELINCKSFVQISEKKSMFVRQRRVSWQWREGGSRRSYREVCRTADSATLAVSRATRPSLAPTKNRANVTVRLSSRALFNYDPNDDDNLPSIGLAFFFGDILHVTNASDDEWWQATKVTLNGKVNENYKNGIIPSKDGWERKQRTKKRSVKFENNSSLLLAKQTNVDEKKNYLFSRKFPFTKNKSNQCEQHNNKPSILCYTEDDIKIKDDRSKEILYRVELPFMDELTLVYLESDYKNDDNNIHLCDEETILSYKQVGRTKINFTRPIIILGPMKDQINDDLINEFPEKFASCIPHTTRSKRDNEVDGEDYFFIKNREEMERDIKNCKFIEAGQYNNNLYGTSLAAVKNVAMQGKHCILDVSAHAIKRLHAASLYPIVIFIKMKSLDIMRSMDVSVSIDQAKKIFYQSLRTQQEFMDQFTGIIEEDDYKNIYNKVKENIFLESNQYIWIPIK